MSSVTCDCGEPKRLAAPYCVDCQLAGKHEVELDIYDLDTSDTTGIGVMEAEVVPSRFRLQDALKAEMAYRARIKEATVFRGFSLVQRQSHVSYLAWGLSLLVTALSGWVLLAGSVAQYGAWAR